MFALHQLRLSEIHCEAVELQQIRDSCCQWNVWSRIPPDQLLVVYRGKRLHSREYQQLIFSCSITISWSGSWLNDSIEICICEIIGRQGQCTRVFHLYNEVKTKINSLKRRNILSADPMIREAARAVTPSPLVEGDEVICILIKPQASRLEGNIWLISLYLPASGCSTVASGVQAPALT